MLPTLKREMGQRGREYHTWIALCLAMDVKKYVELGCWAGHAANFALEAGIENVTCVDLTPPISLDPRIRFIHGDTHNRNVIQKIRSENPDAIFIDADHETDPVTRDFEAYWPITTKLLGFHDILLASVVPMWNRISMNIRSVEIISRDLISKSEYHNNGDTPCMGIGVLFKEGL